MKRIMTLALWGLTMPLAVMAKGNVTGTVFKNGDGTPIDFAVVQLIDAKTSQHTVPRPTRTETSPSLMSRTVNT